MGRLFMPGGPPPGQTQIAIGIDVRPEGDQVAFSITFGPDTRKVLLDCPTAHQVELGISKAIKGARGAQIDLGINGDGSAKGLGQE